MYKISNNLNFSLELNVDSFEERIGKLLKKGQKIVYIKNEFDNSTFRYRCYNIVQALEDQTDFVVSYFLPSELSQVANYIDDISLVVLQRAMWDINIDNFIFLAKQKNIPVIYDIDDLIYNPKYVPIYLNNLGILSNSVSSFDVHFNFASKYYALASKCDGFIVTNKYLKDIVEEDFSKPVEIIQNFLNKEQEEHSELILKEREEDISKFVIGYFSGSPSHRYDLNVAIPAISNILEKYKDIYFKIVGYIEIPEKLKNFSNRIIQRPFVSYEELQYEIGEVDLNIVPLQNNIFNNCKSELKFFEAGIVKVPSCCSPTFIYKEVVEDNKNGFLCRDYEWFDVIEKIYLKRYNLEEIQNKAHISSLERYGVKRQKETIMEVYERLLKLNH